MKKFLLMICAIAVWLTACDNKSSDQSTTDSNTTVATPPSMQEPANQTPSTPQAQNTGTPSVPDAASGAKSQAVNLQANHPNGVTLLVKNVTTGETNTSLLVSVTNGYRQKVFLNGNPQAMLLRDNMGNVYHVVTPPDNKRVRVDAGKTLEGTFSFAGRINPQATQLTLVTNDKFGDPDADYSTQPKMTVDIPIPR